jgi:hypothetical protein
VRPVGLVRRVAGTAGAGLAVVALLGAGLVTAVATPAAADGFVWDVTKTVVGTAPAGTTFSVEWSCTDDSGNTLVFPAAGGTMHFHPTVSTNVTCSVLETVSGGAVNVAYHCSSANVNVVCSADGKSAVLTGSPTTGPVATFTVTNAYSNFFSPPVANPNPSSPGQQVTITGTGCTKGVFGGSQAAGGNVTVTIGFTPPNTLGPAPAQGGTGTWSFTVTVPPGTPPGSYPINAVCDDPVPYPAAALAVVTAPPPLVAAPAFTG